jgi:PII-like signaling protein
MKKLNIYLDNTDTYNSEALWKYLLKKATETGLRGATVYKAVAGVGSHKELHTFDILTLSTELPIIIELIDTKENIESFLKASSESLKECFVTLSDIEVLDFK